MTAAPCAGENALPVITACGVNVHALDVIVRNSRAVSSIPRRASDVATRSLAQRHYQVATQSAPALAAPHGPVPLPHSISFSPPVQRYFMQGGLQRCSDVSMRKAPSSADFKSAAEREDQRSNVAAALCSSVVGARSGASLAAAGMSAQSLLDTGPGRQSADDAAMTSPASGESPAVPSLADDRVSSSALLPPMRMFTFLRLTEDMIEPGCKGHWMHFMSRMRPRVQHRGVHGDA